MAVVVTKEIKALLEEAYESGKRYGLSENHNRECELSGEEEHKVAEISFEDWYMMKVIDSGTESDTLFT